MHFGTSPDGVANSADATLGFDTLRYLAFTPPDPAFDVFRFDFDRDVARTAESSKIIDADALTLNSFAGHAKLILYHGLSDQGLSPLDTLNWYEHLQAAPPGAVKDWARLFLVPGMTHCAGGPATDQFDTLAAIVEWVEKGQAPGAHRGARRLIPGPEPPAVRLSQGRPLRGRRPASGGQLPVPALKVSRAFCGVWARPAYRCAPVGSAGAWRSARGSDPFSQSSDRPAHGPASDHAAAADCVA